MQKDESNESISTVKHISVPRFVNKVDISDGMVPVKVLLANESTTGTNSVKETVSHDKQTQRAIVLAPRCLPICVNLPTEAGMLPVKKLSDRTMSSVCQTR